jgi:hypothetical protein
VKTNPQNIVYRISKIVWEQTNFKSWISLSDHSIDKGGEKLIEEVKNYPIVPKILFEIMLY